MAGYVFFGNTIKPTKDKYESREPIKLNNVNRPGIKAAMDMGYDDLSTFYRNFKKHFGVSPREYK